MKRPVASINHQALASGVVISHFAALSAFLPFNSVIAERSHDQCPIISLHNHTDAIVRGTHAPNIVAHITGVITHAAYIQFIARFIAQFHAFHAVHGFFLVITSTNLSFVPSTISCNHSAISPSQFTA